MDFNATKKKFKSWWAGLTEADKWKAVAIAEALIIGAVLLKAAF